MTRSSVVLAAIVLLGSAGSSAGQAAAPAPAKPRPGSDVWTRPGKVEPVPILAPQEPLQPPTTPPTTPAGTGGRSVVVTQDGSVETTLPDGSKRISRPGECGHVTV